MTLPAPSVLLVGCGKMGAAMRARWRLKNSLRDLHIIDPHITGEHCFAHVSSWAKTGAQPDICVLAVKPQNMTDVCRDLGPHLRPEKTAILSIAAGCPLSFFEDRFSGHPIVRAMPNTPAAIGAGISAAIANARCTPEHKAQAALLLEACGKLVWIEDEDYFHAITALSGSGPAYVFYLAEMMERAGIAAGLPEELAKTLARATVEGAGALAAAEPDASAHILRQNVTSPGGTTAAAMDILGDGRAQDILSAAIKKASERSRALMP